MSHELATFEVPRVSVDLLSDDLSGREKLTVLKYISLEEAISQIGRQRFGATIRDNIPLKPIRDWVTENWEDEFVYDLQERNVPITFRIALALALFTTRVTEHLTQMGQVEVYPSGTIQKAMQKHGQVIEPGLSTIDYASLSPDAKSDLVMPIIDNLTDAEIVTFAGYLFPDGVSLTTAYLLDPGLIFMVFGAAQLDDTVTFDRIDQLDIQAAIARASLSNIQQARAFEAFGKLVNQETKDETTDSEPSAKSLDDEEVADIYYDPGTSFLDVFPYKEGDTSDDVLKAFKRITGGGYYSGRVDQPHRGEYLRIHIAEDGRLIGLWGFDESGWDKPFQEEIDMLSERMGSDWSDAEFRRKNIFNLVNVIRDELDMNKRAITEARNKYGQTSFTVEQGFLEALTERSYTAATKLQIDEDKRLAKEAEKTARAEEDEQGAEETNGVSVKSNQPIDERILELDYSILRAIRENLDSDKLLGLVFKPGGLTYMDNIGDWFTSCASLVSRFQAILIDTPGLFNHLGIQPTNDLTAIRRAYRIVATETHPDKTSGLPLEEQLEATGRFLQATSSYRNLEARVGHINIDQLAPTYYLGRISQLFVREIDATEQ